MLTRDDIEIGDFVQVTTTNKGTTINYGDTSYTGRACGSCTLCCRLMPVQEIEKPAGEQCKHACESGCAIYPRRPMSCKAWACRWLADKGTADLPRPDESHYVIDMMEDVVIVDSDAKRHKFPALQVWVDPAFPDAHRTPELRAYMQHMAVSFGLLTIIRLAGERSICVIPPHFAGGTWIEQERTEVPREEMDRELRKGVVDGAL